MALVTTTDAPPVSSVLLIDALNAESEFQTARGQAQQARNRRDQVLYEMWRAAGGDSRAVAAMMPATVTTRTVKAAVLKLAPPQDFTQLSLLDDHQEPEHGGHALAA
ncbi:hypothetical protein ACIQF6_35970 [Kitasatospora sp. NPDC092948]|uniref:hypothetical protein n=1 Tax=Kitasatospora sp. NPDC092948 TaxID=3364088 RepID=UPI0038167D81